MQNQWYIARDGKQYGPVSDGDLAALVRSHELLDDDYLWRQGFENWLPAGQVTEVRELSASSTVMSSPDKQFVGQAPGMQGGAPMQASENMTAGGLPGEQGLAAGQGHLNPQAGNAHTNNAQGMQNNHVHNPHQAPYGDQGNNGYGTNGYAAPENQVGAVERSLNGLGNGSGNGAQNYGIQNGTAMAQDPGLPVTQAFSNEGNRNFEGGDEIQDLVEENEAEVLAAVRQLGGAELSSAMGDGHLNNYTGSPATMHDGTSYEGMSSNTVQDQGMSTGKQGRATGKRRISLGKTKISWPIGVGIGIAAIFLLLVGATIALPFIVPPETIKNQITAAIKAKTGRDVSFKGKMSYRFFPSFGLDLNNIVIHNPPEIKGPDFVSVGRLQADLKILPLLSSRVDIKRITLHRPEITLINDGSGRTNYSFKTASMQGLKPFLRSFKVAQNGTIDTSDIIARTLEKLEREEAAQAAKEAAENGNNASADKAETAKTESKIDPSGPKVDVEVASKKTSKTADIQVGEIQIINGAVKMIDQKLDSETEVNAINLTVTAPSADQDVTAKGTIRFMEDRINIDAKLTTLGLLLEGKPVKTAVNVTSERIEGKFTGQMKMADKLLFNGTADIQTFSLQKLANWFGVDVPKQGYGGGYIRGNLIGGGDSVMLKNATIKVDQSLLIGNLRLRFGGPKPRIEAALKTDLLDLTPYLTQSNEIKRGALDNGRRTAVAAWAATKIDVSFLKSFDGHFQLDAGRLIAMGHPIEKGRISVKVNAGLMTANIPSFELYGGTGSLNVSVNGAKAQAALKGRVALRKVQVKPLLINAADLKWISGDADLNLDITSSGATQKDMINRLNGTGKFVVLNGALEGVNIPGMIRNLQRGNLLASSGKPSEKTDFSELSATFNIDRGIVKNKDLKMKGPLLRMSGEGTINLPAEQIDYGLAPKLVADLNGQGGGAADGVSIPLRVKGPLSNPKIIPDAGGLLKNNGKALKKTVSKIAKKILKKKISSEEMKGLLNGLADGEKNSKLLDSILQ